MEEQNLNGLMIFPEFSQKEFNFDSLIGNDSYHTISGMPVKIDRIIRDITATTVVAVSGTMVMRGVKVRGVWDMFGNIIEYKKMLNLFTTQTKSLDALFSGTTQDLFRLVHFQNLEKKSDK